MTARECPLAQQSKAVPTGTARFGNRARLVSGGRAKIIARTGYLSKLIPATINETTWILSRNAKKSLPHLKIWAIYPRTIDASTLTGRISTISSPISESSPKNCYRSPESNRGRLQGCIAASPSSANTSYFLLSKRQLRGFNLRPERRWYKPRRCLTFVVAITISASGIPNVITCPTSSISPSSALSLAVGCPC